ncbi:hypothetical protein SLS56_005321 [Neofusicoccum ribis]|uniref:Heterokaryon incompatibility domain-containing protein n=1 Tax=Neofusicoccum ribis TaxID=45134 RepID=A0ABR3STT1_9PEZI
METFRDAVIFASHLENVRFIWIDSLCIVQRSDDDRTRLHEEDWNWQSALMDNIYHHSYLNISAASSVDSSGGLFFPRNSDLLREEEINLNVGLLPDVRVYDDYSKGRAIRCIKAGFRSIFDCIREVSRQSQRIRCTIHTPSLWEDLIERAQVNTRGWVYQERLLAPRVLYFCGTQIAWECSEVDCCESYVDGVPSLRFKTGRTGGVALEDSLKSLDSEKSGKLLREARLRGLEDPDKDLPGLYTYELWKQIVEVYSGKTLSCPGDKLIALSGIAKHFFDQKLAASLFSAEDDHPYIVGFWRTYLESQLLWYVNPIFDHGRFYNEAERHSWRAPSFSWAALDVPQGIKYGDFTDQDVLFQVLDVNLRYKDARNKFGMVEAADCYLLLNGRMREIELRNNDSALRHWDFVDADKPENPSPEEQPHVNS